MTHQHGHGCGHHDCGLTPAETAELDQLIAGHKQVLDRLTATATESLDCTDEVHAACSIAVSLGATATPHELSMLVGFAVVRLAGQMRAEMCPCLPDAPAHEHLTGGYSLTAEERSGVEWRIAHGQPAWPDEDARPAATGGGSIAAPAVHCMAEPTTPAPPEDQ